MSDQDSVYLSQNEQSSQSLIEITKNSYLKLQDLVPNQGKQKSKRNYKSKLWNEKNVELLYRLNVFFSGSIDMIFNYFKKNVKYNNITLKKIKQKFKQELKNNPEKLNDKALKPKFKDKIQKKLELVAQMQSLDLVARWSQVSEIDNNQIIGSNQIDTEIQNNLVNDINSLLKANRFQQAQLNNQPKQK